MWGTLAARSAPRPFLRHAKDFLSFRLAPLSRHTAMYFGPDGAGDGRFYRTASGEWVPDGGAWQFQGYDENGLLRSVNGRLTGVHNVLCSAASRVQRTTRFLLGT